MNCGAVKTLIYSQRQSSVSIETVIRKVATPRRGSREVRRIDIVKIKQPGKSPAQRLRPHIPLTVRLKSLARCRSYSSDIKSSQTKGKMKNQSGTRFCTNSSRQTR